jgi:uncharacterized membrane protein
MNVFKRLTHSRIIETLLDLLGSWGAMIAMGVITIVWAVYDHHFHKPTENLDIGISIWTLLLDVFIIMASNQLRRHDRQIIKSLEAKIDKMLEKMGLD